MKTMLINMKTIFIQKKCSTVYRNIYLIMLFFVLSNINTTAQWEAIHPPNLLHSSFVKAIVSSNNNDIFAIGTSIAISTNKGIAWEYLSENSIPVQVASSDKLCFPSVSESFLIDNNRILRSIDSGKTWQEVLTLQKLNTTYNQNPNFNSIYFPSPEIGFAVGTFDKIFKTTDSGLSWDTISWNTSTLPYRNYLDVYFINNEVGFVSGYEVPDILMNFGFSHFILKTTDGGDTWNNFPIETTFDYKTLDMQFIDEANCFVRCSRSQGINKIYSSADSCKTWSDISPPNIWDINCMHWINNDTGFVFGLDSTVPIFYRTSDRGSTWQEISILPNDYITDKTITDINFINSEDGFAVGEGGNILITNDAGLTWTFANKGSSPFYQLAYPTNDTAYATLYSGKGLVKTSNGGYSWERLASADTLIGIYALDFNNSTSGYIKGYFNRLYKTSDGGQTFEYISLPVNFYPYAVSNVNIVDNTVFITGQTYPPPSVGMMLQSSDDGKTWELDTIYHRSDYFDYVSNNGSSWLVCAGNNLYKSDNNGKVWDTISYFSVSELLTAAIFIDSTNILACISQNTLIRTTNSGKNWDTVSTGYFSIKGLLSVNDTLVYAYGIKRIESRNYGAVWKSIDAGRTWNEDILPALVDSEIVSMSKNKNYVYAYGGYGQLFRFKISEPDTISSVKEIKHNECFNIYPNPSTNTIYCSLESDEASLKCTIYNLNGIAVMKSQMNKLQSNVYSTDIAKLSSGIYLISINIKADCKYAIFVKQ